jgi:hypothetical protein
MLEQLGRLSLSLISVVASFSSRLSFWWYFVFFFFARLLCTKDDWSQLNSVSLFCLFCTVTIISRTLPSWLFIAYFLLALAKIKYSVSFTFSDMRRDVQEIFRSTPHEKQVMMFSATLSKDIRPVCKKFMQDVRFHTFFKPSFYLFGGSWNPPVGEVLFWTSEILTGNIERQFSDFLANESFLDLSKSCFSRSQSLLLRFFQPKIKFSDSCQTTKILGSQNHQEFYRISRKMVVT